MNSSLIGQFEDLGFKLDLTIEGKLSVTPAELTATQIVLIKEHRCQIIHSIRTLNDWKERLVLAQSQQEIFDILDMFRLLDWTCGQRAEISRVYNHRLEVIKAIENRQISSAITEVDKPLLSAIVNELSIATQNTV